MGIFNFISGKKEKSSAVLTTLPGVDNLNVETNAVVQETDNESKGNKPLTVSLVTGWPIDIIYGYLHKNFEEQGFENAMVNSDLAFCNLNMDIIKNKILLAFREINLNYDTKKQDTEIRMETCRAAGLLSIVSDLEKNMAIINAHREELQQLEDGFRNNANEASIPLKSYKCGFLRGIATIALSGTAHGASLTDNVADYKEAKVSA